MSIEDRIAAMLAAGTLTQEQADKFRSSTEHTVKLETQHRRKPVFAVVLVLLVVVFILFGLLNGGTDGSTETIQNVAESMNQNGESGTMDKSLQNSLSFIVILLPVLLCAFIVIYLYNSLVKKEEEVFASWSQVESQYQRRADLIPNLVNTVQGYAEQEKDVLIGVTAERARLAEALAALQQRDAEAGDLTSSANTHLDDELYMQKLAMAQQRVSKEMFAVFALVENYPALRSSDNFMALQDQIEGTENRINIARMVFNESVNDYNRQIRVMPSSMIARASDFKRKAYFKADENSSVPPAVSFD